MALQKSIAGCIIRFAIIFFICCRSMLIHQQHVFLTVGRFNKCNPITSIPVC